MYYDNINGLITKQDSLKHILAMKKPDLVALCETKLHLKSKFTIDGYEVLKSNLKLGKEGILVAAKIGTYNTMEMIYEADSRNIATVEIEYPKDTVRIIVVHGPQETADQEEKEEFYNDLSAEIERSLECDCRLIIAGDFNARVEHHDHQTTESKGNGKRVKDMIDKYELRLLNIQPETEGQWTRIQNKNGIEVKSEIDYILTDMKTKSLVQKTIIDEDKVVTPYRVLKKGKKKVVVFSDHCAMMTSFNIPMGTSRRRHKVDKIKYWVLTEEGMAKYQTITESDVGLGDLSLQDEPFDLWKRKVDEKMHLCFKRRTVRVGDKKKNETIGPKAMQMRAILNKLGKTGKIQREIVKSYQRRLIEKQAKRIERRRAEKIRETVEQLTIEDKLSPNAFWKMRKSVTKNCTLRLPAVYKSNGTITSEPSEIKDEVRKEFQHRLRNREPCEGWDGYVDTTNSVVEELLKDVDDRSSPFTFEEMKDAISKLKDGVSPDHLGMHADILSRSGMGILEPLLEIFNIIKVKREIPETWRKMLITMIYKNKGSRLDLEKYRGIFLTVVASKVFERMLKARMKSNLDRVSLFQAGSRNKKGAADDLFLLRSSIDHSKYINKSIYVTTYDFRQAFDSLWLQDCILVLRKLGVEKYILKLIYEMNKKAVVQIKTPYGLTEPFDVTDIVKQGGILGSPMCSATTAEYCEQNKGISMGNATIASLAFVDDIADISTSFEDAINSHKNALEFAERKKLQLAHDKCFIMLINRKRNARVPELEIKGEKVQEANVIQYLGDVFNDKGNNDDLMGDRAKRGTASMISIQGFMREASLGTHTLSVYLLLHNSIFLAGMLFNAEVWSNITDANIKTISTIQLRFLKKMMGVRQATSNSFVYLELGILPMKYEIHRRQISFLYHILELDDEDPVKKVWRNQTNLPDHGNWWCGVKELMQRYSLLLNEEDIKNMAKDTFKKKVKSAVTNQAYKDLTNECKLKKKTSNLRYEKLETQKYIKVMYPGAAKIIFKCRAKTLNIKEHMTYKYNDSVCRWCGICDEKLEHIVNCGRNEDDHIHDVDMALSELDLEMLNKIALRVDEFLGKVEV